METEAADVFFWSVPAVKLKPICCSVFGLFLLGRAARMEYVARVLLGDVSLSGDVAVTLKRSPKKISFGN